MYYRDRKYGVDSEDAKNTVQLEPREYTTVHGFAIKDEKLLL
jgi:hypothetical protein